MADKQRSDKAKQPKDTKSLTGNLAYSCMFCARPTNFKDNSGAYCAECYGKSRYVPMIQPYTPPHPYPSTPWQPNVWHSIC